MNEPTILEALTDPRVFGPHFRGSTWKPGFTLLASLFGLPLHEEALAIYRHHSGRSMPPTKRVREAWIIAGREPGKRRRGGARAAYLAGFCDWRKHLASGERAIVTILAVDRDQANVVFNYIAGLVDETPMIAAKVESRSAEAIHFTGRVSIVVQTSSFRS